MDTKKVLVGRLAFRHEGEWWHAYWAPEQHSMERAILLGSIRMSIVQYHDKVRTDFIKLMRTAFSAMTEEVTGAKPTWGGERPAPENERSGHA